MTITERDPVRTPECLVAELNSDTVQVINGDYSVEVTGLDSVQKALLEVVAERATAPNPYLTHAGIEIALRERDLPLGEYALDTRLKRAEAAGWLIRERIPAKPSQFALIGSLPLAVCQAEPEDQSRPANNARASEPRRPVAEPLTPYQEDLVKEFYDEAAKLVAGYAKREKDRQDIFQVARLGLILAAKRFDPDRGVNFMGFAIPTILGEVKRYFRDYGWDVSVPRRVTENYKTVRLAVDELRQELRRDPHTSDIAERTGLSAGLVSEIRFVMQNARVLMSLNVTMGPDDEEITADKCLPDPKTLSESADAVNSVLIRRALEHLPAVWREVVVLRYWGQMSQSQIAERVGYSQVHVSRILRQSEKRLHLILAVADPLGGVA